MHHLRQWFSTQSNFASQRDIWECLESFWLPILGGHGGDWQHLVSSGQRCCYTQVTDPPQQRIICRQVPITLILKALIQGEQMTNRSDSVQRKSKPEGMDGGDKVARVKPGPSGARFCLPCRQAFSKSCLATGISISIWVFSDDSG